MMRAGILAAALLASFQALAQVADAPSDLELSSGYCFGVIQQRLTIKTVSDRPGLQAKGHELWTYLVARGVWTSQRSLIVPNGVNIAIKKGRADGSQCTGLREACIDRCVEKVNFEQCFAACFDARCARTERCTTEAPQLPF